MSGPQFARGADGAATADELVELVELSALLDEVALDERYCRGSQDRIDRAHEILDQADSGELSAALTVRPLQIALGWEAPRAWQDEAPF